ncbi:MAG: precorrin-2 C(20)-methyltransferase [Oscillospiraceae bacterium]|nr:precorrin-2 C(20)-methyltransferase [Oscillospiraceae bacterium]
MEEIKKSVFYCVGVGPGDPELLTRKACRVLESCPVVAAVQTPAGRNLALDIAGRAVDLKNKEILLLPFSMERAADVRKARHDQAAGLILNRLEQGTDVAMAVLGDVSLYASCSYLTETIQQAGYECVMIPGVTSFCAAAARLGRSLTSMDEPLTIVPAGAVDMEEVLDLPGTKVLMKPAGGLRDIGEALKQRNLQEQTGIVIDCGLPGERVMDSWPEEELPESYFTTILIGKK